MLVHIRESTSFFVNAVVNNFLRHKSTDRVGAAFPKHLDGPRATVMNRNKDIWDLQRRVEVFSINLIDKIGRHKFYFPEIIFLCRNFIIFTVQRDLDLIYFLRNIVLTRLHYIICKRKYERNRFFFHLK